MDKIEARKTLKLCVQNMNWVAVRRLADAVAALGKGAGAELNMLAEWKHQLAKDKGDAR